MATSTCSTLGLLVDPAQAKEEVMLSWLLDRAMRYYQNPKNRQAFEAWKKSKSMEEAHNDPANYDNA